MKGKTIRSLLELGSGYLVSITVRGRVDRVKMSRLNLLIRSDHFSEKFIRANGLP